MFTRLIAGALFAGLSAGLLAAALQLLFVVPLIQLGEQYESGALVHFTGAHDDAAESHDHGADGHVHDEAAAGPGRALGSVAMFLVTYTGFAAVMVAGFALADRMGHAVTARQGAIWGLAGFIAVQLAPAFGLPPELPGGGGAPLADRQVWWAMCVALTAGGIGLIALGRGWIALAAGVALIALPHVIGAPEAEAMGVVPPELAAMFTARALGVGAVAWVLLGTVAGAVWARDARAPALA